MNKLAIFITLALVLFLTPAAYSAAFVSYGLPESKAMVFGSPDGSADNYYGLYVDSAGKVKVSTVDSITSVSITTIDTVEVLETVEVVSEVTNVTSVDTVDLISDITGGTIDTVSSITAGNIDIDYSTESFLSEVERGNISGVEMITISSFHTVLSSSFELVSASNSPEVMLTTAEVLNVSSSSATDDKDLTGALSLTIYGSNAAGARISESINLEGLASQETTLSFYCIDNVEIDEVGSGGAAVGDIYVYEANALMTDGIPDGNPLAKIPIGYGACGNGKFYIPAGDTGILVDFTVSCGGTGPYEILVMRKAYGSAEPARMIGTFMMDDGAEVFKMNEALDANDYVYFLAKSGNAGDDIAVRARFLVY